MIVHTPDFRQERCLNTQRSSTCETVCTRCRDVCPAQAIEMNDEYIPHVNESRCTGCTACVHMCPSNAISHTEVDCIDIIQQVHELARQGKTGLWATCHAVCDTSADLNVPCHALWDPLLLACIAAEGIQTLRLEGINQCVSCPARYGAGMMVQTEKDYAVLNKALGTHLKISWDETPIPAGQKQKEVSEPARRTFFRNLFPTMAQGAIMAAARLQQLTCIIHKKG